MTWTGNTRIHPAARMHAAEFRQGRMSRREFLTRATGLGLSAGAALALAGHPRPVRAAVPAQAGGTLRIQQEVRQLKDARTYDWPQIANLTRGTLEYLVQYENDGSFTPMLLAGWEVADDARAYTLHVRPGVRWSNGDSFTAADVARNIARWCEADVPGNSMAGRFAALIDPDTGRARAGAIEVVDGLTVRLHLSRPDITLIASMSDYPAAIVHESYDPDDPLAAIGTGPYRIDSLEPGRRAVLLRDTDRPWWGSAVFGGPFLDRIEFIDLGTDPASWVAALQADEVDMLYESVGAFIDVLDGLGFERSEVVTMSTIVVRPNQQAEVNGIRPYADRRVRRALQMAVDNAICLELGYAGRGEIAENHHIGPKHPEYAPLPPQGLDPRGALELLEAAGLRDFEHELISIDDDWRRNTADAVAAQLRDAGIRVRRTVLPGLAFWENWARYPFSCTDWNHRPLGVQNWALAYRSGAAWNEFGWSNPEFDALLDAALGIVDAERRRAIVARGERLIQEEGVTIQPYWRTIYRHMKPGLVGAQMHISYELHLHRFGWAG